MTKAAHVAHVSQSCLLSTMWLIVTNKNETKPEEMEPTLRIDRGSVTFQRCDRGGHLNEVRARAAVWEVHAQAPVRLAAMALPQTHSDGLSAPLLTHTFPPLFCPLAS